MLKGGRIMSKDRSRHNSKKTNYLALGLSLGLGFGVPLGVVFGAGLENRHKENSESE
jgi:hypothetical protein